MISTKSPRSSRRFNDLDDGRKVLPLMAEPREPRESGQVARLAQQVEVTTSKIQDVNAQLQAIIREQVYTKEDVTETRRLVETMSQRLWEGDISYATRLLLVERKADALETSQVKVRDFWLKVLAPLVVAGLVAFMGLVGIMYMLSKGVVAKP